MGRVRPWDWATKNYCLYCGNPAIEYHHCFPGSYRKKSDEYGYIIPLCRKHHTGSDGIHFCRGMMLEWQKRAQRDYEMRFGTREDFIKEFGKNRL